MNKLESARAEMKGIQADVFAELKRIVKFFSLDEGLRAILDQSYFEQNYDKFVLGVDGEKCYGVIDKIDLGKRDEIVREVVSYLLDQESKDTDRKWCEFSVLAAMYFQIDEWLESVDLVVVLKHHMKQARKVVTNARELIDLLKFSKN